MDDGLFGTGHKTRYSSSTAKYELKYLNTSKLQKMYTYVIKTEKKKHCCNKVEHIFRKTSTFISVEHH